jgi:hypothetical protein
MAKKRSKTKSPSNLPVAVNKGGRPKAVVDEQRLEDLAAINCTVQEIADVERVHVDTIYARYSDILRRGRSRGSRSLKSKLFEKAMAGDMSALVWLSKQQCGYREPQKLPEEATLIQYNVYVNEVPK